MVAESQADTATDDGGAIRAHFRFGAPTVNVAYPRTNDGAKTLALKSGATIALSLTGASTSEGEYANGYLVYRGGLSAGGDVIVRPTHEGFEDHFYFASKPPNPRVEYALDLPPDVAGLRLSGNVLELVDAKGTPLMHAAPPFVVDAAGKTFTAVFSVGGCAVDKSTQPSWRRQPTPPGAATCRVAIAWDDSAVQYPALLDPNWAAANTMSVPRLGFQTVVLSRHSPQQVVALGGVDLSSSISAAVEFFDVDSGTWSVGPPLNVPRAGAAAVAFNTTGTVAGDRIFVSGGQNNKSDSLGYLVDGTTEVLAQNPNGDWAWSISAPMQSPRVAHTATLLGNRVVLAGGWNFSGTTSQSLASCELYDLVSGTFVSPAPPNMTQARDHHAATLLADGQTLLVAGGTNENVDNGASFHINTYEELASAELFVAGKWIPVPDMASPHSGPAAALLDDGRVMIAGGVASLDLTTYAETLSNQVELFTYSPTPPFGNWTSAEAFSPVGRTQMGAALLANGAALLGPGYTDDASFATEASLLDPTTGHSSKTTTASPHRFGGVTSAVKSDGTHEAIVFGGAGSPPAGINGITEVFTLTPTGQACGAGPECVGGICEGGICQPHGFPLTIDATALSNKGLVIVGFADIVLDTNKPRSVRLPAGSYSLQVYAGLVSSATFVVKADGTIDYDPSLEGVLLGRGTTALKINGRTITVDATPLSQSQLALLAYHYQSGVEVDRLAFATNTKQTLTLLPLADFGYQFDVDGNYLAAFKFNIDVAGNVLVPSDELTLARGSGGSLLRLGGAHVSITIPTGLGAAVLGGGITISEGATVDLQLLPYAAGSTMALTIGGQTTTLTVNSAGYLDGDPMVLHILGIHGDGAPMCDAENTQALAAGWDYTPINSCGGASSQTATGYIDAPAINPTVTARINGAGRPPAALPRNRRPAGGDPVLGDGEFLMDRTDVSLPGLGIHYEFHRSYRSGSQTNGPLSPGWEHNYDQRIIGQVVGNPQSPNFEPIFFGDEIGANCDGTVQFQDGTGSVVLFKHTNWAFDAGGFIESFAGPTPDLVLELHLSVLSPLSTTWRLIRNDGQVTTFDRAGFLSSITDPVGNSLTFGWSRATPPPPPQGVDCRAINYQSKACASWLYSLTKEPIGQRRRLMFVSDAARTIYYVYSQSDTEHIYSFDRLECLALANNCDGQVLASFGYDTAASRLTTIRHGGPSAPAFETYAYHAPTSDSPYCHPNPEIAAYCHSLCDAPATGQCGNQNYTAQVEGRCAQFLCNPQGAGCDGLVDPFTIRRGTAINSPSICCDSSQVGDPTICRQFLWDGPNCVDGCENQYQCTTMVSSREKAAAYSIGVGGELTNDITDVYDNKGNLVVHNVYGEDRNVISFDKVTSQTLGSASTDNTIAFEYHDLTLEALPEGPPVFNDVTHYVNWAPFYGSYSTPDPDVNQNVRPKNRDLEICPKVCPGGGTCDTPDYGPAVVVVGGADSRPMVFATVIHDLHSIKRIQYSDPEFNVMKEVTLNTGEVTEFNYTGGGIIPGGLLRGVLSSSGVRTCIERDNAGRIAQSSTVAAPNYDGTNTTQATTYSYYPNGQLKDEVHDVFGQPTHTHYERDSLSRVIWIDQDVNAGVRQHTSFSYDGETLPKGILETPTSITYPNRRTDTFSQFDPSLAGPKSSVIDSTSATPDKRYTTYDAFGRVIEAGDVNRFAQHYAYADSADIWRMTSFGHRLDPTQSWVDTTISSHAVDGENVTDSVVELLRTTKFTVVGRFPTQKDVIATVAPPGTSLPATQTSCYNYSPDGRLEAIILPEGNGLLYHYAYGTSGTTVTTEKGFVADTSAAWATGCRGHNAQPGDPAMGLISSHTTRPGGFILAESSDGLSTHQFVTDGFGRIIQRASSTGNAPVQQLGYDSKGDRVWEALLSPPGAISTSNPYHKPALGDSNLLSFIEYEYDFTGRVTKQISHVLETGEALLKQTIFDDVNNTVTVIDRGVTTVAAYDGRDRLASTLLPDQSVRSIQHLLGVDVVTTKTNSQGNITRTYNYDTRGLLLNVQDAQNALLYQATYDPLDGKQLTETRAGLGQATWTYDAFRRMVREDKVLNANDTATSTYQYDRNDRMTVYQDAKNAGHPWQMTYTSVDAPLTVLDPEGRVGTYTYAAVDHPEWPRALLGSMQEPNGRIVSFAYDAQSRLIDLFNGTCPVSRSSSDCGGVLESQKHLTYGSRGNIAQIDDPTGKRATVQLTTDSLGRPVDEVVGLDSAVHHSFTDQGRTQVATISYAPMTASATIRRAYDGMGRLNTVDLQGVDSRFHNVATYDFGNAAAGTNGIGGPLSLTDSNGAKAKYSYDSKLRQTGIDVYFGGQATSNIVASVHEAFGKDSIARMRQRKIGPKTWTDGFQVDSDGRLTHENLLVTGNITLPTGEIDNAYVAAHVSGGAVARQYDLDKIGNIAKVTAANSTLVHEVNRISKLTKIGTNAIDSDNRDNLVDQSGSSTDFAFDDFWGTLSCAGAARSCPTGGRGASTFEYDALNRRRTEHRSDGDRVYIWDGNRIVGHGTTANLVLDVAGNDIDEHLVSIDAFGTGSQWFYHQGADESVFAVTGSKGLVEAYTYSAFGELTIRNQNGNVRTASAFANIFQFQGQVYDDLARTYSMRAREYQPEWGTFLSQDPIGTLGGQSMYAFAGSRPLAARDPLGLEPNDAKWLRSWMASWDSPFAAPWDPALDLASTLPDLQSREKYAFYYDQYGDLHAREYLGGWYDVNGGYAAGTVCSIQCAADARYLDHYRDNVIGDNWIDMSAPPSAAPRERFASFDEAGAAFANRARLQREWEADGFDRLLRSLNKELLEPLTLSAPFTAPVRLAGLSTAFSAVLEDETGALIFTSPDKHVGELATAIEEAYPGHVVGVNVPVLDEAGNLVTDADILLKNAIIQVKGGAGTGLGGQILRTEAATDLPVIGYGPDLGYWVVRGIQQSGGLVTRDAGLLIQVVAP